jgi:hypothetical protein
MNDRELYEEGLLMDLKKTKTLIKELFELLDKTEETDEGRVFHPNQISSCRAVDVEKLGQVLIELRNTLED